jgi:hypothetical protein
VHRHDRRPHDLGDEGSGIDRKPRPQGHQLRYHLHAAGDVEALQVRQLDVVDGDDRQRHAEQRQDQ